MKAVCVTVLLIGQVGLLSQAQEIPEIENWLDLNDVRQSEAGYEDVVNTLEKLYIAPLNLNTVDFDSLKLLFFLSDKQIDQILAFRSRYGPFLHVNELLLAGVISKKELELIKPFIYVEGGRIADRIKFVTSGMKQEILAKTKLTYPLQEGYKSYRPEDFKTESQYQKKLQNRFKGIPLGVLFKYKNQLTEHLHLGLTLENDPGEPYFTRYQKMGFDFFSAYAGMVSSGAIRRIIIGDYRLQWGQGLVAWNGFASGKSSVALGNEKSARGFSPYTSTDENNFLRGVAFSFAPLRNVLFDVCFSYKKVDGNLLQTDSLSTEEVLTASLYQSGYHRNENECKKKHQLKEKMMGAAVSWNTRRFKVGFHGLYYDFKPEIDIGDEVYRQYNDKGKKRMLVGVDYKTGLESIYFFGETAFSETGKVATLNGLRFSGNSRIGMCLLYRRYDKKYVSHYAGGFGEYSNTSNEEGFYVGVDLVPVKNLKINAYYDYFRFFSARYNAFIPAEGREILIEIDYSRGRFSHLFRFKQEEKPENLKGVILDVTDRLRNEYRYQLNFQQNKMWEMRTRLEYVIYRKADCREKGFLFYQDLIWHSRKEHWKTQFRIAYFRTDSYNARIYSYEHNVLYGYSFPAYFNKGWRTYLNVNWKAGSKFTFYLKTGLVYYPDSQSIGSSLSQVKGNKLSDMTFQVRYRF